MFMFPTCNCGEEGKGKLNTSEFLFTEYGYTSQEDSTETGMNEELDTNKLDKITLYPPITDHEIDYPRPNKKKNPYTVVNLFGCTVKSNDPYCLYLEYSNEPRISPIHEFYKGIPVKEETTLLDTSNAMSKRSCQKQEDHKIDSVVGKYRIEYTLVLDTKD